MKYSVMLLWSIPWNEIFKFMLLNYLHSILIPISNVGVFVVQLSANSFFCTKSGLDKTRTRSDIRKIGFCFSNLFGFGPGLGLVKIFGFGFGYHRYPNRFDPLPSLITYISFFLKNMKTII